MFVMPKQAQKHSKMPPKNSKKKKKQTAADEREFDDVLQQLHNATDRSQPQQAAHDVRPAIGAVLATTPRIADWRRLDVILTRCIQGLPMASAERAAVFAIRDQFKSGIRRERKVVLTGTSGSGKSSLLNELMGLELLPAEQSQNDGDARTYFPIEVMCDPSVPVGGAVVEARFIHPEDYKATHNRHSRKLQVAAAGTTIEGEHEATDADICAAEAFFANVDDLFGSVPRDLLPDDAVDKVSIFLREHRGQRIAFTLSPAHCSRFQRNGEIDFPDKKKFFSFVTQDITIRGDFRGAIPAGVSVVDCPGSDDTHPVRALNRIESLQSAFAMINVANFGSGNRFKMKLAQNVLPEVDEHNPRLRSNCMVVAKNVLPSTIGGLDKGVVLAKMNSSAAQSLLLRLIDDPSVAARSAELLSMIRPDKNGKGGGDDDSDYCATIEKLDIFGRELTGGAKGMLQQHKRREMRKIFVFLEQAVVAEQKIFARTCDSLVKLCSAFVLRSPSPAPQQELPAVAPYAPVSRVEIQRELLQQLHAFIGDFPRNRDNVASALDTVCASIWHWRSLVNFSDYGGRNGGCSKYSANFHQELATRFLQLLGESWETWVAHFAANGSALHNHLLHVRNEFERCCGAFEVAFYHSFSGAFQQPANPHHPHHAQSAFKATAVDIVCDRWSSDTPAASDVYRVAREVLLPLVEFGVNTAPLSDAQLQSPPSPAITAAAAAPVPGPPFVLRLSQEQRRVVQTMRWFFEVGAESCNLRRALEGRHRSLGSAPTTPARGQLGERQDSEVAVVPFLHPKELPQLLERFNIATLFAPGAHVFATLEDWNLITQTPPIVDALVIEPPLEPTNAAPQFSDDDRSCVICLVADAVVTLLPCLHTPVCEDCSRRLLNERERCPLCRLAITSTTESN